ncbi:Tripeptidyl aminopeptidase [Fulvia fulva]|nr:Tripeptidyl aminopeptidase [Fulvia fulva]KAK4613120.1 Tripeptidyl aminopeptidase [Fulvia fulva]WPV21378.1 Tripeptidyl aminopeptidase [Fulvia fulva]WPV36601.1 Tripeptidyl aminopeptidase [Fulvia fulva]
MRSTISTLPLFLSIVAAASNGTAANNSTAASNNTAECNFSSIRWGLCDEAKVNGTLPMDCATLRVPLDYSDPASKATILLELARVPSAMQPSKGSIQFNFGGPGATGRGTLAAQAAVLRNLTGGQYDLIAFDPRGTGDTLPFLCVQDDVEATTVLQGQASSNTTEYGVGRIWARGTIDTARCQSTMNETGKYVNTPFAARDLMSVVDALNEDGMLRYWGLSYGTTLGATVAAMFPNRIDKLILDGVQNPHEYYHALADFEEWTDSDKVFAGIFSTCIDAGGDLCPLASLNLTGPELEGRTWHLLEQLKSRPIPIGQYLIDYPLLKGFIQQAIYGPAGWPGLVTMLSFLFTNQTAGLEAIATSLVPDSTTTPLDAIKLSQALLGIHCGDRTARAATLDDFQPTIDRLYNISTIMGDATIGTMSACAQWSIEPAERFQFPSSSSSPQIATSNPILIVGNTFDGHTPLISAYNVSETFEESVVMEVRGYGHASLGLPSSCTWRTVSEYFSAGTVPEVGRICEVEAEPYGNTTWADIFGVEVGGNGGGVSAGVPRMVRL